MAVLLASWPCWVCVIHTTIALSSVSGRQAARSCDFCVKLLTLMPYVIYCVLFALLLTGTRGWYWLARPMLLLLIEQLLSHLACPLTHCLTAVADCFAESIRHGTLQQYVLIYESRRVKSRRPCCWRTIPLLTQQSLTTWPLLAVR